MTRLDHDLFERLRDTAGGNGIVVRVDERIAEVVAPLETERDQLLAERDACREYVQRLDTQIGRINRIIVAAKHGEKRQAPRKETTRPSRTKLDAVLAAIDVADGPLTNSDIVEATGISKPTVNAATYHLRRDGAIRRAGTRGQAALYTLAREAVTA